MQFQHFNNKFNAMYFHIANNVISTVGYVVVLQFSELGVASDHQK